MDRPNPFLTTPMAILLGSFVIAVAILMAGGVVKLGQPATTTQPQTAQPPPAGGQPAEPTQVEVEKLRANDHIKGESSARVLLIEYSDLECPFCKRFHPTAQQAVDEYKSQVAWVYRHFPLDTLHSKADKEAEASECAAELGGNDAFWAYLDKVFEATPSNNGLNLDDLPKLASDVGLDQGNFAACLNSGKYKDKVESQYQGGVTAGVTGTPGSFVVNKKGEVWMVPGAIPYDSLKATIEKALKS